MRCDAIHDTTYSLLARTEASLHCGNAYESAEPPPGKQATDQGLKFWNVYGKEEDVTGLVCRFQ